MQVKQNKAFRISIYKKIVILVVKGLAFQSYSLLIRLDGLILCDSSDLSV